MNTYAPNTLYDNLGYEPLNDSERYKQFYHGGKMHKAQGGFDFRNFMEQQGGTDLANVLGGLVTGSEVDEEQLYHVGERIVNLQRAILVREGHQGRKDDRLPEAYFTVPLRTFLGNPECLVPGVGGEVTSRKGAVVDRDRFEEMKSEYYRLRDWDVDSGLQPEEKLKELGLSDIAAELKKCGLLA